MKRSISLLLPALAIAIAACSGAASPSPSATAAPTPSAAATPAASPSAAPSASAAAMSKDIVETASEAGSFATLLTAATAAGLVETLQGEGPYTVFAPTDDAFATVGIDSSNCEALAATPFVTNVLRYHVAKGRRDAADVTHSSRIRMLNREFTRISTDGNAYFVNDARIIVTDVFASNGVIHALDGVLLP